MPTYQATIRPTIRQSYRSALVGSQYSAYGSADGATNSDAISPYFNAVWTALRAANLIALATIESADWTANK
jgi:hypothetical protein